MSNEVTLTDAGGMGPSIPLPGYASCLLCGWGATIDGAEELPINTHAACPQCAAALGFGDGSKWELIVRKPRPRTGPRPLCRTSSSPGR